MTRLYTRGVLILITLCFTFSLNAQVCWLAKDSIIQGRDSSETSIYNYVAGKLVTIEYIDSGSTSINSIDSILYGSNGKQSILRNYDASLTTIHSTTTLTYDASDRVTRVHIHQDDGQNTATIAHDISYNSSGEITDIIVDPISVTGNPDGFPFNFENLVWQGGGVASLSLVGDIMGTGVDTIELTVAFDTMNNVRHNLPIEEVGDLIESVSSHNILSLTTVNDEAFGPAGTLALDRTYTYNSNNDVITREDRAAVFNSEEQTIAYGYQCSGIGLAERAEGKLKIYPNPASDFIHINAEDKIGHVTIYTLNGAKMLEAEGEGNNLKLSIQNLPKGLYILEVQSSQDLERLKFVID